MSTFPSELAVPSFGAQRLYELAAAVRAGEEINWERERDAMALELVAFGKDWCEDVCRKWKAESDYLGTDHEVPEHLRELLGLS